MGRRIHRAIWKYWETGEDKDATITIEEVRFTWSADMQEFIMRAIKRPRVRLLPRSEECHAQVRPRVAIRVAGAR